MHFFAGANHASVLANPPQRHFAWRVRASGRTVLISSLVAGTCANLLLDSFQCLGQANAPLVQPGSVKAQPSLTAPPTPFPNGRFLLQSGDVVAFVGGADVAAAQHTGHLETLLTATSRGQHVRFRNFGWEGDTVFAQPRDFGFPPLVANLERAHASVIVVQFGRTESLSGIEKLPAFTAAYKELLNKCARLTPRIVLVTPPPFESASEALPNLAAHNTDLAAFSNAIRELARQRNLPAVDLFAELTGKSRLTSDGLQLSPAGHGAVAAAFSWQIGFGQIAEQAGAPDERGQWLQPEFENLRQLIIAKNDLWSLYWRPQNWAFLGGDRVSQPSSRDHRNPNLRWFPDEMEKYLPLIETKENGIYTLASKLP
jgi:hypothetical protein